MKKCARCRLEKDLECFHKNKWRKDGLNHYCKSCKSEAKRKDYESHREQYRENQQEYYEKNIDGIKKKVAEWRKNNLPACNARAAVYRAKRIQAMPKWVDRSEIKKVYQERQRIQKETGIKMHVDHIIPLNGKTVCGLHCPSNLQIIPASVNARKSNKFSEDWA